MKKLDISIICCILFISSCISPEIDKSTTLQFYSPYRDFPEFLNGQVKAVKEVSYSVVEKNGAFVKGEICPPKERMINSLPWDFVCFFNEMGQLNKSNFTIGEDVWYCNFEHENNLISKVVVVNKDTIRYYHTLKHDENGHLSVIKKINPKTDSVTNTYKFQMNKDGFVIGLKYYNTSNELYVSKKYIRDENNLTKEFARYNGSDSLLKRWKKYYNDKGFYMLSNHFNGNNELINSFKVQYTSYDSMGNWTSKTGFKNDTVIVICEREYEYY